MRKKSILEIWDEVRESYGRDGRKYVKVNGNQYRSYMEFVKRTGIDVHYRIRVQARGGDYFYAWGVLGTPVRFEWLRREEE